MTTMNVEESVKSLEHRASAAEKALAGLNKGGSAQNEEIAARLRQLHTLMLEDREECEGIRAQRDELKEENERLRAQVAKHEYRIKHLLRTINEIEASKQ